MNYRRLLPLVLALGAQSNLVPQIEKQETVTKEGMEEKEITLATAAKVDGIMADQHVKQEDESKIKDQQKLEEDFWESAYDISDALNEFAFKSVVNQNTVGDLEFASVDFKMLDVKYKIRLSNPENIDRKLKYNIVLFMNNEKIPLKSNNVKELAEDIRDYVQDSLMVPPSSDD